MHSILDEATVGAAIATREEEVRRQQTSPAPTAWNWRVEPGKEEEFEHLRGWFLSSLEDGPVEVAIAGRDTHVSPADPARSVTAGPSQIRCRRPGLASRRRLPLLRAGACLVGRAFLGAGRRLVEWSDEPL